MKQETLQMMEEKQKCKNYINESEVKKYKSLKNKMIKEYRKAKETWQKNDQCKELKKNYIEKTKVIYTPEKR